MQEIAKQQPEDLGIRETKFYSFRGEVPPDFLNFFDQINTALDLPPLEEAQVMLLAKFVMYEFATFTMADIEDAIFKAKAGKLECNAADYNKLSIDFIGRILNAYKDFKNKNNLIVLKDKSEEANRIEYTPNEGKQSYEFIKKCYDDNGEEPRIANWNTAFRYMEDEKMIILDNDEKSMFMENVRADIYDEMMFVKAKGKSISHFKKTLSTKSLMKYECRKKMVITHFEGNKK